MEIRKCHRGDPTLAIQIFGSVVPDTEDWDSVAEQEQAYEESQKYKEGKFIIEKARVMKVMEQGT